MFDLERELDSWCRETLGGTGGEMDAIADEMRDHLRCAVESRMAEGAGAEEAFRLSVAELGEVRALARQPLRNRGRILRLCALAGSGVDPRERVERRKVIGHSFVWAAVMIASALMVRRGNSDGLLMILLAGWFATSMLVSRSLDPRAEWLCFRRWLAGIRGR